MNSSDKNSSIYFVSLRYLLTLSQKINMLCLLRITGDKEFENIPSIKSKALRINLNENIYGSFAEIGAGQETVRNFFKAGGASGTIAKTMSAYDKDFSDSIYGIEERRNRYVTESRVKTMLSHEIDLIEERLQEINIQTDYFFLCQYSSNY